jgi:hypothetical protein
MIIRDVLARDLGQRIEEIIKVDQLDEQTVYNEITEYVATERIKEQYRTLLKAIADYPSEPHEGIGVWISGFFGSGKSSFAKNLGYVLSNPSVLGNSASELFKNQVKDARISEWIDLINTSYPMDVIMFDIQSDRSQSGTGTQSISSFFYRVLLRQLGYAEDFDLADLEISLENEGKLEEFIQRYDERYAALDRSGKGSWTQRGRTSTQVWNRAGVILHEMDSSTYPAVESFAQSLAQDRVQVTPGMLVKRTFDLASRRRPGHSIVFVVDEVGQYVAYNQERLEDLRRVVELFGTESKNRLKTRQIVSPVWVIVTAQEKLDEVTSAMGDDKKVLLAKVRDRFKHEIDLSPADIQEVATKRVLAKTEWGVKELKKLYSGSQGQLNLACRLERTSRKSSINEQDFVQFYPYLPHFIDLSIEIMSGIRLQIGALKHLGGSNRTIIKQAHEMLVSERTAIAEQAVGQLVTLDRVFELVEGNLSTEKQKDIYDISQRFGSGSDAYPFAIRVAKALCLLEFVRDLPRTEPNVAACLVDSVGQPAPFDQVVEALQRLREAQFVRNTETGWKLQTAQEKNWESERRSYLDPKPKDRNDILREIAQGIFSDAKLRTYRYRDLRSFRLGITVNGISVSEEGQVTINLVIADTPETFADKVTATRDDSRQESHCNNLYWVLTLNSDIDSLIANLFASRQMVNKYNQLQAQNRITKDESASLESEKLERSRWQSRLSEKLVQAMESGTGLFRGVGKDGGDLGKTLSEMLKKFLDLNMPNLYPKLVARPLKGSEPEEILKAANLNGLSQVFYSGEQGLNLVIKDGAKFVPNPAADTTKEVSDYLKYEFSYGNKDTRTGKHLEQRFGGLGYGWDVDLLRLVLAVLFRAGAIDVSAGGQKFDSYQDPRSRTVFISTPVFRSALFTPAKVISLKDLRKAVEAYEELSGATTDLEKSAIAGALKKWADEELKRLYPVEAQVKANHLPVLETINEFKNSLYEILQSGVEDCVNMLVGGSNSLAQSLDKIQKIRQATDEHTLQLIRYARQVSEQVWPQLELRGINGELAEHIQSLRETIDSAVFYDTISILAQHLVPISQAYIQLYQTLHQQRTSAYQSVLADLRNLPEWEMLTVNLRSSIVQPLTSRACAQLDLIEHSVTCRQCHASLPQMESDLAAVIQLKSQVIGRIKELTAPEEKVEKVHLASFFTSDLQTENDIESATQKLCDHLLKLLAQGVKIVVE